MVQDVRFSGSKSYPFGVKKPISLKMFLVAEVFLTGIKDFSFVSYNYV